MNLKRIAIASMALAAVAAAPAFAACPDPAPTFGTLINGLCPSEPVAFCNVQSNGTNIRARFWGYNQGNFAVDNTTPQCATATCGADNGNWQFNDPDVAWLLPATDDVGNPVPGKYWIFGDWAGAGSKTDLIDGCPTTQSPKPRPVMYVGISDRDAAGNGLFAIAWAANVPGFKADYDFSNVGGAPPNETGAGAGNIVLRTLPRPFVQASVKVDTDTRDFTLRSLSLSDIQAGLYGDDSSNPAEAVQGFKIYRLIRAGQQPALLPSLDRAGWTAVTPLLPLGAADQVISVDCSTPSDVFFAYSIVANSGFEAAGLGTARGGQCGPTLADPADPKIKPIDRPKKNVNPNN